MDRPVLVAMPLSEDRETAAGVSREVRVARTRSVACGAECRSRPCTLREMTVARQLADDPRLILWVELLTVAHLVGEPEPRPDPAWLDDLRRRAPKRTLECALAHLVEASIDSRYTGLVQDFQPEELAVHLADCTLQQLNGQRHACAGDEVGFQAGRFRWIDVIRALKRGAAPTNQPHPLTPEWERRGLSLPSTGQHEQLEALRRHPSTWRPSGTVIVGRQSPPRFELAAKRLANSPDPIERLEDATRFLNASRRWPALRLYPSAWHAQRAPHG
jgi:hypothetical protein